MANGFFDLGRQKFGDGQMSWIRDTWKLALIDTNDHTINLATDEFLSDIAGAAIVATSGALTSLTNVGGVLDAADVVLGSVTGDQSEALVIYHEVPTASGTGDTVSVADGNGLVTFDDAAGLFVAGMERGFISFSGMSNGANNGAFYVERYVSSTQVILYNPAGLAETSSFSWQTESPLALAIDTATGLPVTPNSGDITIAWDSGANKIAKL